MQSSLFGQDICEKITLEDGELWWFPNWLSPREADCYFECLRKEVSWQQSHIRIAGKTLPVPRLNAWYGEKTIGYEYSGIALSPQPFTATLNTLKSKMTETFQRASSTSAPQQTFSCNSALINLYRDGNDSVAWHADDEPELGIHPQIASVSLGASRRFLLKPQNASTRVVELLLTPGSLLFMRGELQHDWLHSIPKTKTSVGSRINITFRQVYSS